MLFGFECSPKSSFFILIHGQSAWLDRQNVSKEKEALKEKHPPGRPKDPVVVSILKSTVRTFGTQLGHQLGEMIPRVLESIWRK